VGEVEDSLSRNERERVGMRAILISVAE